MTPKTTQSLPTNEETPARGAQELYPNPPGHEEAGSAPAECFGQAALDAAEEGREDLLERAFKGFRAAATDAQATVAENFATPPSERRQAHSPLLQKRAQLHVRDDVTLRERVARILK